MIICTLSLPRLFAIASIVLLAGCAATEGRTPLMAASRYGQTDVARNLIGKGTDVNARDNNGMTALMTASFNGQTEVVKLLLDNRANVNATIGPNGQRHGATALMAAAWGGHKEIVLVLLEKGADVNAVQEDGNSALTEAAMKGNEDIVHILLENGANPNQINKQGLTPTLLVIVAAKANFGGGHERMLKELINKGAEINARGYLGYTALIAAAEAGRADMVHLLLVKGANVNATNSAGKTAWDVAADHPEIRAILPHGDLLPKERIRG